MVFLALRAQVRLPREWQLLATKGIFYKMEKE